MSLGKPVISSDWRFLSELVKDDYNGKLFDINSPKGIKNKIEFYLDNNDELIKHARNAYLFSKNFDSNHWNKHIYNRILSDFLNTPL